MFALSLSYYLIKVIEGILFLLSIYITKPECRCATGSVCFWGNFCFFAKEVWFVGGMERGGV